MKRLNLLIIGIILSLGSMAQSWKYSQYIAPTNATDSAIANQTIRGRVYLRQGGLSWYDGTSWVKWYKPALFTSSTPGLVAASGGGTINFLRADGTWALAPGVTDLTYTASTRVVASSTGTDATLPLFTSTDPGLTPLSGGGSTNFLRADGTWAAPPGSITGTGSASRVTYWTGTSTQGSDTEFTYDAINNILTVPEVHAPTLFLASTVGNLELSSIANTNISGDVVSMLADDDAQIFATDVVQISGTTCLYQSGANTTMTANGDLTLEGFTGSIRLQYGTSIILDVPGNNNSVSQILGRNSSTGVLEYKDLSSFGSISGSIAATQVAFGSGADAITGEAAFNYTAASNTLQVNAGTINVLGPNNGTALLVEDDAGNNIIHAGESAGAQFLDLTGTGNINISFSGDVGISGNTIGLSSIGDVTTSSLSSDLLFRTGSTTRLLIDADGSFAVNGTDGTSGQALVSNGSGSTPTWQTVGGVPGGSNTQVQFNNSGVFGGDADLTFDNNPLSNVLKIGNLEISGSPSGGVNAILFNNSGQLAIGQTGSNALPLSVQNGGLSLSSSGSGDVGITVNSGAGSYFIISGLPTTCAGAPTGALANISGVLNICP